MRWSGIRLAAAVTQFVFLANCATQSEPRRSVEVRHFELDWSRAEVPRVALGPLEAEAIVLAPAQWPLESSVKRLLSGDFTGVVDAASFRFRSSRVPEGVFEDLYAYGLVAAYVRVMNPTDAFRVFDPIGLALKDKYGVTSPAVSRDSLPRRFSHVDWNRSAQRAMEAAGDVALAVVVVVAVIAAEIALEGRVYAGDVQGVGNMLPSRHRDDDQTPGSPTPMYPAETQPLLDPVDPGILGLGRLSPHSAREGVVFFLREPLTDWSTAVLAAK
jgi:hypothetical protein